MINFIDINEKLTQLDEKVTSAQYIAIDTEFIRRNTYYAKLSLIQLAFGNDIYVIDSIAADVSVLWKKIATSNAIKIIHSGRQDIELLNHLFSVMPNNIFDTQIAAGICGFSRTESYAELCKTICNIELDKSLQDTNWLKRPLTKNMLEYAAIDVKYLHQIYEHFTKIIHEKDLWAKLDVATYELLLDPKLYNAISDNAWKRIRHRHGQNQIFMERLKIIGFFREECARKLDIPRRFFASDEQVIEICEKLPTTKEALNSISNISPYLSKAQYSEKLYEICIGLKEYR
ncbi:MAG: hypothetical protein RLZZ59_359 [Pseudomonadota bacterium]|jgi:ribonuclease D